ncbi:S1 family peptidase [Krasilnikovia sp. MM14-A1259]|uniref:S1 family peptidase n=1 Tax=Krasilnikovia sp. MM14-A1259 TaxID=3373539 RepID=UPI00399C9001
MSALCLAVVTCGAAAQAAPVRQLPVVSADDLTALNRIVTSAPHRFAGVAVDEAARTVDVFVPSGEQARAGTDLSTLPTLAPAAPRLTVRLVPVPRSQAELDTVFGQISARQPWASAARGRISAWYVNPRSNKVTVGLSEITDAMRAAARATFGDAVELTRMEQHHSMAGQAVVRTGRLRAHSVAALRSAPEPAAAAAPTRLLDSRPYYGGDRIIRTQANPDGTTSIWWCTGSFTVLSGSTRLMSTAGHCGPAGTAWQQGYFETGTQTIYVTGPMGTVRAVQWGNNRMDAETLDGGSYWPGAVYGGQLDTTAWGLDGQQAAAVGSTVCSDGSVTRESCAGRISAINACLNLNDNGTTVRVCNQALADSTTDVIVQHGDSGGPVLRHPGDPNRAVGLGIISGGSSNGLHLNFTQIQDFSSTFGATVASGNP